MGYAGTDSTALARLVDSFSILADIDGRERVANGYSGPMLAQAVVIEPPWKYYYTGKVSGEMNRPGFAEGNLV